MIRVAGIVLAAGMSRRLGRPKQLLMLGDQPVIRHVVQRALASSLDEVIVVLGARAGDVKAALNGDSVRFVVNERFEEGQGTSLAAGVAGLGDEINAAIVILVDQPEIDPATIARVADAHRSSGASIVMAQYGNERGHPVLFSRQHFPALMALEGDEGGRRIIKAHATDLVTVPGGRESAPPDIDTEEAWQELSGRWSGS